MLHRYPLLTCSCLLALSLAVACDKGETPIGGFDDEGCDATAGDDGGVRLDVAAPVLEPIAVDCSFSFPGLDQTVRFEANVDYEPRVIGGDLNVVATLTDEEFEGRSFSISVFDIEGTMGATVLYQFPDGTRPVYEFAGDHGFTGLHWVQDPATEDNVQWACFARDPDDPVQGWEE